MNTKTIQSVVDWMKKTDLSTVSYRKNDEALELSIDDTPVMPASAFPPCRLVPVAAREVGLFRFSALGSARSAEKGSIVNEGDILGLIVAGKKEHPVKAPASGKIVSELIEDGDPVEYGQPIFFIQP